jgi:hypothetical protein
MNLKLNFKNANIFKSGNLAGKLTFFWQKIHIWIFFVLLVAVIAFAFFVWQSSLNGSGWDQQRKQEYLNSQDKNIVFKENEFKKVIADIEKRFNHSTESYEPLRNIFEAYK